MNTVETIQKLNRLQSTLSMLSGNEVCTVSLFTRGTNRTGISVRWEASNVYLEKEMPLADIYQEGPTNKFLESAIKRFANHKYSIECIKNSRERRTQETKHP